MALSKPGRLSCQCCQKEVEDCKACDMLTVVLPWGLSLMGLPLKILLALHCSETSKQLNESRIKVLQAREEAVMQLVSEAEEKLASIAKDKAQYKSLLTDLLVQVRGDALPHM